MMLIDSTSLDIIKSYFPNSAESGSTNITLSLVMNSFVLVAQKYHLVH
jgi:hypothetical protein